jgi:hypothetical protein
LPNSRDAVLQKASDFLATRQKMAANHRNTWWQSDTTALQGQTKAEDKTMKKRWMKSVIETSKQEAPALPFQRSAKRKPRPTILAMAKLKSA